MKKRLIRLGLVIVASFVAAGAVAVLSHAFTRSAWPVYDLFERATAPESPSDVVMVYITQNSLDTYAKDGDPWPWPRQYWGVAMKAAQRLGAKSVTFDINFANSSSRGVADDEAFNASLKAAQVPVVMPGPDGARLISGPNPTVAKELESVLSLGVSTIPAEADGLYRSMPADIRGHRPLGFARAEKPSSIALRYYKHVPFTDVVNVFNIGLGQKPAEAGAEEKLRGKHWVIGAAAPGLLDLKPTPVNAFAPGAEIHATALANLLENRSVHLLTLSESVALSFLIGLVAFAILLFSRTPIPALVGATAASLAGPFLISAIAWGLGSWFNPLPTLTATGLLALGILGARFQLEWRERQRLAKTVENSMSTEMVEMVRSGRLKLKLFGERRDISIFFCDLSGFTTISESLDAAVLVDILNLYLEETVNLVFKHNGFVDKFIGDAVMALWGAPLVTKENHAALAVQTAVEFQTAFSVFREKARALIGDSANALSARVGIHSGSAIVGNIGSQNRYNYTAVGDPVNLASRLEGLGKQYDSYLLLSEEILTASGRRDEAGFVEIDLIAVKGKSSATRIFTHDPKAPASSYAKALDFYRRARFAEALDVFESIESFGPAHKMAERCRSALKNGIPNAFRNGVWHFDEK